MEIQVECEQIITDPIPHVLLFTQEFRMQLLVVRVDHSPVRETKNRMSTIEWENILKYHLLNHLWHTAFIQTCHSMN